MKSKTVSAIGIVIVIIVIIVSVPYLRKNGGVGISKTKEQIEQEKRWEEEKENLINEKGQSGEADDISKAFVTKLDEKTGTDVDPRNVVSTGKPIMSGIFEYTVNSWNVSKEYPGYKPPEGVDLQARKGVETDANGNITNGFSYVTVDISAKNMKEEEVTMLVWSNITLKIFAEKGQYSNEPIYIGRDEERAYGHNYGQEQFQTNETKNAVLIFIAEDEWLSDEGMYLLINTSGASQVGEYDVRRFIILN